MVTLVKAMQADPEFGAMPVVVASNNPEAAGLKKAQDLGVATLGVDHRPFGSDRKAFEQKLLAELKNFAPDIICLAGFMRILTADFITEWEGRMLNIHPSLLPKYKGLNTHQRAIDAGDKEAGCSVHIVTPELDDGPVLGQTAVSIKSGDTANTVAQRVLIEEHKLYPAVLKAFVKQTQ